MAADLTIHVKMFRTRPISSSESAVQWQRAGHRCIRHDSKFIRFRFRSHRERGKRPRYQTYQKNFADWKELLVPADKFAEKSHPNHSWNAYNIVMHRLQSILCSTW